MSYLSFIKIGFKNVLAYKFEVLMWTITIPVSLAIYFFLWGSIYAYTGQEIIRGFTFPELLSYFVLVELTATITWTQVDNRIAGRVRSGDLVVTLIKPAKVYFNFLFRQFGGLLFHVPINAPLLLAIGIYFFDLNIVSFAHLSLYLLSLVLSLLLFYSFAFLLGTSSFWLKEYSGIRMIKDGVIWLFGGGILPIVFFPNFAQKILAFLPFQYMLYTPVQIFLGNFAFNEIYRIIALQIIWIVLLYVFIQIVWKKAMLKFSGVGV